MSRLEAEGLSLLPAHQWVGRILVSAPMGPILQEPRRNVNGYRNRLGCLRTGTSPHWLVKTSFELEADRDGFLVTPAS